MKMKLNILTIFVLLTSFSFCDEKISVTWEGSFTDMQSMSFVNRSFTNELNKFSEIELSCVDLLSEPNKHCWQPVLLLSNCLSTIPSANSKITIRQSWLADWRPPKQGKWVMIQPWDYGVLPAAWIDPLQRVDEIWAPSNFVKQEYIDSGIPAEKVFVIPNGFDPHLFHPNAEVLELPTNKKFKFLFVGELATRKGFDLLLKTYMKTFSADDDVCLVVKTLSIFMRQAEQPIKDLIHKSLHTSAGPEVIYIENTIPLGQMPGLYTACDCLIHPFRGEGFGLPMIEAMACGLPLIVTDGGGAKDFVDERFAWLIPAQKYTIENHVCGIPLIDYGWLLEPDETVFSQHLRYAVEHAEEGKIKGLLGSEHAHTHWTWKKACEKIVERLRVLSQTF